MRSPQVQRARNQIETPFAMPALPGWAQTAGDLMTPGIGLRVGNPPSVEELPAAWAFEPARSCPPSLPNSVHNPQPRPVDAPSQEARGVWKRMAPRKARQGNGETWTKAIANRRLCTAGKAAIGGALHNFSKAHAQGPRSADLRCGHRAAARPVCADRCGPNRCWVGSWLYFIHLKDINLVKYFFKNPDDGDS